MTLEEALEFVESILQAKTDKPLTAPEKEILKAAWDNETYSTVADRLYMSVGHIKDLASRLWKRLSDLLDEKVTKNNFRRLLVAQSDNLPIEDSKGNILIVDALVENLHFLNEILTKHGYNVRHVTNSTMALQTVQNLPPPISFYSILKCPILMAIKSAQP